MTWLVCVLLAATVGIRQEIVVTAERTAVPRGELTTATSVITREEVEKLPASNAAEVLTVVPGIVVFSAGSTQPATLTMRGFYGGGEADYARLLVDGAPAADAESNVIPWQQMNAAEIERIEVVRGMASPVYGDAAFGGVVQVFTRRREPGQWMLMLTGGSDATAEGSGGLWTRIAEGELSLLADWRTSDGDRPHAESRQRGARVRWRRDVAGSLLALQGSVRAQERNDPGPLPLADLDRREALFPDDRDDHRRQQLAASFDAARWRASVHANAKRGDATRTILVLPPFADTASRRLDSGELGASVQMDAGPWHGGIDVARQTFDAEWLTLARANESRTITAAHASARVLRGAISAVAGARFDALSTGDRAFSPRAGIAVQRGATSMYISAAQGFTAPTMEQLYDARPLRLFGSSFTLANPELAPQRARGLEAGIARQTRWGSITLDAYASNVRDEIDFDARTFRYANIARSHHRGAELSLQSRLVHATYAWTRVTSDGAQLKNVPEHAATLVLPFRDLSLVYLWNAGRYYDDAERIAAPDTHTLNVRAQHRFGRLRVLADVLNLLDAPNASLGYALANARGGVSTYAYPDQHRTFRVSVAFE